MPAVTSPTGLRLAKLRWPLPALLAWGAAWAAFELLRAAALPTAAAWGLACLLPVLLAAAVAGPWRRGLVVLGFPLSCLLLGAASLPPWAWLLPLALLLVLYPVQAWRDAPLFPTALAALDGLAPQLALPAAPRLLDAGCGLGHGLLALRRVWPQAHITGLERSAALALATRLRCRWARVQRGDMWAASWAGQDLVYLFQRPESMARAWHKAQQEMAPGSWLVSLEFAVPGVAPHSTLARPGQRPVWVYRVESHAKRPASPPIAAQPQRARADIANKAVRHRAATPHP
jgi:SAM-dependent methyltransferase